MADRSFEIHDQGQGRSVTLLKKYKTLEVAVIDDADTITISGLTTIDNAKMVNLVDGSDIAVTLAGNIITVNDIAATSIRVLVLAVGV